MFEQAIRSGAYAGVVSVLGVRAAERIERRLTGSTAVTQRGLMARRATMALLFRQVKRHG